MNVKQKKKKNKKKKFATKNVITSILQKLENIRYWGRPVPIECLFKFLEKVTRNVKVKGTKRPV